jgi:hypothetical protein
MAAAAEARAARQFAQKHNEGELTPAEIEIRAAKDRAAWDQERTKVQTSPHRPVNRGWRFARNAATPSLKSALE